MEGGNKNAVLVLDIDETMAHTFHADYPEGQHLEDLGDRAKHLSFMHEGREHSCLTVYRPGVREFVDYAQGHFKEVVVWTAAVRPYAKEVLKNIFDIRPTLYSRESCSRYDGSITKSLGKLADEMGVYQKDIIIVDDATYATALNAGNWIKIPAYQAEEGDNDDALYKLMEFFKSKRFSMQAHPAGAHLQSIRW